MKRAIIFALLLLAALVPVAGVAYAHPNAACGCDVAEEP